MGDILDLSTELWGDGKLILGPMVRGSSLPLRLAAIEYGAATVYTEEILASRIDERDVIRVTNECLGTVDFIRRSKSEVIFRTHAELERNARNCVLQIGSSSSKSALKASRIFANDVAAIDINMGCPKHYSVGAGMGCALMSKPERAEEIIKTLRRNLSLPISVKTRLCLHSSSSSVDTAASIEWVERLQRAGACAIAVHLRTPTEKSRDPIHDEILPMLAETLRKTNTPLIVNGDIWGPEDMSCVRQAGAASVMVCRSALWNPSIFASMKGDHAPLPISDVMRRIVQLSISTANCFMNTKYLLQQVNPLY